jgi:hypothetical protein
MPTAWLGWEDSNLEMAISKSIKLEMAANTGLIANGRAEIDGCRHSGGESVPALIFLPNLP